jgi:hypothetical protein
MTMNTNMIRTDTYIFCTKLFFEIIRATAQDYVDNIWSLESRESLLVKSTGINSKEICVKTLPLKLKRSDVQSCLLGYTAV